MAHRLPRAADTAREVQVVATEAVRRAVATHEHQRLVRRDEDVRLESRVDCRARIFGRGPHSICYIDGTRTPDVVWPRAAADRAGAGRDEIQRPIRGDDGREIVRVAVHGALNVSRRAPLAIRLTVTEPEIEIAARAESPEVSSRLELK